MLNKNQLAVKLSVHANTVYNLIKEGMPHIKIGKKYRFDYEEVLTWLKNRKG